MLRDGSTAVLGTHRRGVGNIGSDVEPGTGAIVPSTPRRLSLVNAHTGETFDGTYRDESGPIARVMDELSIFLRIIIPVQNYQSM